MNRAVFLDRDGVITEDPPDYAHKPCQFKLIDGSAKAIKLLNENYFKVVVVSNQSGVARGYYSEDDVILYNEFIVEELKREGAFLDKIYYCPHHPEAKILEYRVDCECRKPKSGMLKMAEKDLSLDMTKCFMIGDKITDIGAGSNIGCKTILVLTGHGKEETNKITKNASHYLLPDYVSRNLFEAVQLILGERWRK